MKESQTALAPDESIQIESCACDIVLNPDNRSGFYTYKFDIKNISSREEVSWSFDVPVAPDQVDDEWAKDSRGNLQTSKDSTNNGNTRLVVRYREQLQTGESASFEFGYRCSIPAIIVRGLFIRIVTILNKLAHGHPCENQTIQIRLPPRSQLHSGIPALQGEKGVFSYSLSNLRADELFIFLIGYKRFAVGGKFLIWLLSAVGSGMIGYLISLLGGP